MTNYNQITITFDRNNSSYNPRIAETAMLFIDGQMGEFIAIDDYWFRVVDGCDFNVHCHDNEIKITVEKETDERWISTLASAVITVS